jgi:hypothetical protein
MVNCALFEIHFEWFNGVEVTVIVILEPIVTAGSPRFEKKSRAIIQHGPDGFVK